MPDPLVVAARRVQRGNSSNFLKFITTNYVAILCCQLCKLQLLCNPKVLSQNDMSAGLTSVAAQVIVPLHKYLLSLCSALYKPSAASGDSWCPPTASLQVETASSRLDRQAEARRAKLLTFACPSLHPDRANRLIIAIATNSTIGP
jgi:hypothetical protein